VTYQTIEILRDGPLAQVRLCRPDSLNSMTREFWSELPQAVRELDAEGKTRVIVLSSTGKHFSAGMDLNVFGSVNPQTHPGELGRAREALRRTVLDLQDSFSALEEVRMPVLAAIHGGCIGGAVDMISACDARYCTADAFFCIQEINIGMVADVGTLQRLPKIMPSGAVRELAYTGRRLPAARALQLGLVNEVFADHAALLEGVLAVAREIAERSPLAVSGTKQMLNYARDHSVHDALQYVAAWQSGMFHPGDMVEAFTAKSEKRAPVFEDLRPLRKPFS